MSVVVAGELVTSAARPPRFAIGQGYAVYRGPTSGDGAMHRHAAFQVAIAAEGSVAMLDSSGRVHRGLALVVAPMATHRISATRDLVSFFVEPHCAFADELRRHHGRGIDAAPELCDLREDDIGGRPSQRLDGRLVEAMTMLSDESIALSDVASMVGLSPPRLRALARREIGMPLTRWRVWSRLRRAVAFVHAGRTLAEAATLAGFADQAQFTRQMREMVGLTPASIVSVVRTAPLRAT